VYNINKGRREEKNNESDIHVPQPQNKSSYLLASPPPPYFFYRVFGRILTRGVKKRNSKANRENLFAAAQKKQLLTYVIVFSFTALLDTKVF
jgi:hypothetical protein